MRLTCLILTACAFLATFAASVHARQWTDRSGRTVEAQLIGIDGETVILQQGLKPLRIPFSSFSDEDQAHLREKLGDKAPRPKPAEPAVDDPFGSAPAKPQPTKELYLERTWTDDSRREIVGTFVQMTNEATVELKIDGKTSAVPFKRLSYADQLFIKRNGGYPGEIDPFELSSGSPRPAGPNPMGVVPMGPIPMGGQPIGPPMANIIWPTSPDAPGTGIDRWWHSPFFLAYGKFQQVSPSTLRIVTDGKPSRASAFNVGDLDSHDRNEVIRVLQAAGQLQLARQIGEVNTAIGPEMGERNSPAMRHWYIDLKLSPYTLVIVEREYFHLRDTQGVMQQLFPKYLEEEDLKFLVSFLEEHKATLLLPVYRRALEARQMIVPDEIARFRADVRNWTLRGATVPGSLERANGWDVHVRGVDGRLHSAPYKEIGDEDARYLHAISIGPHRLLRMLENALLVSDKIPFAAVKSATPASSTNGPAQFCQFCRISLNGPFREADLCPACRMRLDYAGPSNAGRPAGGPYSVGSPPNIFDVTAATLQPPPAAVPGGSPPPPGILTPPAGIQPAVAPPISSIPATIPTRPPTTALPTSVPRAAQPSGVVVTILSVLGVIAVTVVVGTAIIWIVFNKGGTGKESNNYVD